MSWQEIILNAVEKFNNGESSDLNKICKFLVDGKEAIKLTQMKGFKFPGVIENIESVGK